MNNKELIEKFYSAFQQLDYTSMQECYCESTLFNDPVFGLLQNGEPQLMWEMLCKRAKNFTLTFSNIDLIDEEYATCSWTANYIFAATGKTVKNPVKAYLRIKDGLIIEHTDRFNIYNWSKQAFGIKGYFLGWTHFFAKKIRKQALLGLEKYKALQKKNR
jgi:ketosteroid isomerase-like protein